MAIDAFSFSLFRSLYNEQPQLHSKSRTVNGQRVEEIKKSISTIVVGVLILLAGIIAGISLFCAPQLFLPKAQLIVPGVIMGAGILLGGSIITLGSIILHKETR